MSIRAISLHKYYNYLRRNHQVVILSDNSNNYSTGINQKPINHLIQIKYNK